MGGQVGPDIAARIGLADGVRFRQPRGHGQSTSPIWTTRLSLASYRKHVLGEAIQSGGWRNDLATTISEFRYIPRVSAFTFHFRDGDECGNGGRSEVVEPWREENV